MPTVRFSLCVTREEGRNMLVGRVGQLGCRFLKSGWLVPDIKAPCELPEPPQALSLTAAARQPQSCAVQGPAASSSTRLLYGFLLSQEIQPLGTCSSCPQHECSVPSCPEAPRHTSAGNSFFGWTGEGPERAEFRK